MKANIIEAISRLEGARKMRAMGLHSAAEAVSAEAVAILRDAVSEAQLEAPPVMICDEGALTRTLEIR